MLIIKAGPVVIHWEINREQSLAEVQKTIAIYDFTFVNSWQVMERKRGVWLSMLVRPAIG